MRKHRKLRGNRRRRTIERIFQQRVDRFQAECGWCGKPIGEEEPVFSVGGRAQEGVDLSAVQGKVIEILFEGIGKTVLVAVSAFDSPAKAEGNDLAFMTCSGECGRELQAAFNREKTRLNMDQ